MVSSISTRVAIRRLLVNGASRSSSSSLLGPSPVLEAFTAPKVDGDGGGRLGSRPIAPGATKQLPLISRVFFSSQPSDYEQGPAAIDYGSILPEEEFHKLADDVIHDLQEKLEEFGDEIQIEGFDIDYGNQVLTLKLGGLGTYVINKQTPNRQIWLSSPVSGPSRFDWDRTREAWVYRRTKACLLQLLEEEIEKLCGKPIKFS